jgi:signal transduction histidine kinase
LLALTVILLFAIFQKRKNKLLREQQDAENRYREEIIETQIEIKEETLRNISWELHDNIGQLLTLSKIQLQNADNNPDSVREASNTIGQCLEDLRSLSKLINPDTFSNLSLVEALQLEMERFNRMKYLKASLSFGQVDFYLDNKVELIIFRMLQEFFTNTIKHSKGDILKVKVDFSDGILNIEASDNGIGFDTEFNNAESGIGLMNIKNRAALIGADVQILSKEGEGTQFKLTYKKNNI